jgi:creatinine amidohydrolase/Fe(II)-dependent formamide hydrolase-like protein
MEHKARAAAMRLIAEDGTLERVSDATPVGEAKMYASRPFGGSYGDRAHGGEEETSLMLFLRPHLVNMEAVEPNPLRWRSSYLAGSYVQDPPVVVGRKRSDTTPLGHNVDPTLASAERGKLLFEAVVDAVVRFVKNFRTWHLDQMVTT